MRWVVVSLLGVIGCSAAWAPPAVVVLDAGAHEPDSPLPPCPQPAGESSIEVELPSLHRDCDDCALPLVVVVRNPNEWPVFVTEAHALRSDRSPAILLAYDPILVPPDGRVVLPSKVDVRVNQMHFVRVFYIDGWGHEHTALQQLEPASTSTSPRQQALPTAEPWCSLPESRPLLPLAFSMDPAIPTVCQECDTEVKIRVHNPNAERVRIVHAGVVHPDGSSTWPAVEAVGPDYLQGGAAAPLHYRIALGKPGIHELQVKYVDGWAQLHLVSTHIDVRRAPAGRAP